MADRPRPRIVAPRASVEETAAVVAALEQFMRAGSPLAAEPELESEQEPAPARSAWLAAALQEGVERRPEAAPSWAYRCSNG
jgi:hypothetical protein